MVELAVKLVKRYQRFIKFGIVGSVGALLHYAILFTLTEYAGLLYMWSAVVAVVTTTTVNYVLNHKWTFKGRRVRNHFVGWLKYELIDESIDVLYLGQLALFVEIFGIWYMLAAFIATLINYPLRYALSSWWIWRERAKTHVADYDWVSFYDGNFIQRWWKRRIANEVWRAIPANSVLLDIGCGSSPIIGHYDHAIGIDTNEEKLKFLKEKYPHIETRVMSAEKLDFPDEYFDYVICIELLEHLASPQTAISEIARVLKKGGKAVIATPDYKRKHWQLLEQFTAYRDEHVSKLDRKLLEGLCGQHGLVPVRRHYVAQCDYVGSYRKTYGGNGNYKPAGVKNLASLTVNVAKLITKPRVARANIALTYRCDYRCQTCNMWLRSLTHQDGIGNELRVEELEKLFVNNKMIWATYTGGEITLRPDITDIFKVGAKHLKVLSATSNGSRPEKLEKAVRSALQQSDTMLTVSVSLEGDKKTHEDFTRIKGSHERVIETLQRLSLIKCNRLKVGIEWLSSMHTIGQFRYIKEVAYSLGVGITVGLEQEADFYKNTDSNREPPPMPRIPMAMNTLNIMGSIFTRKVRNIGCVAGTHSVFISPQGLVYPCLFKIPDYPLVNLRDTDYKICGIKKENIKKIVKECEGCWTPCETYATMVFRPHRIFF